MNDLCLVTGGAGFIGSHLVDELVHRGKSVRVLDDLSTGLKDNLSHHGSRIELIEGSITDSAAVAKAVAGAKTIFHLGALASVARSVETPVVSHAACATGTVTVLDEARKAGVKRVVYAGSSSAYGNAPVLPKVETMPTAPLSPYALQKLVAEQYCQMFTRLYGLETVTIRYFNVFGPRQDPSSPYSGVISLFISALCDGRQPKIYGDGEHTRDFTYVANVVDGVLRACTAQGASGEVINVATAGRISLNQLFRTVRDLVGANLEPVYEAPRAGDVKDSQADIAKAERLLGYQPIVPFEEGLRNTVNWYRGAQMTTIG